MKKVSFESWDRFEHYTFFKDLDMPRFLITVDLDVTQFVRKVKEKKKSFYLSLMHLVMQEINQMENFLYRMIGNDVYLLVFFKFCNGRIVFLQMRINTYKAIGMGNVYRISKSNCLYSYSGNIAVCNSKYRQAFYRICSNIYTRM